MSREQTEFRMHKNILITLPSLKNDPGGVAGFYNSVLPHLSQTPDFFLTAFQIGSTHGKKAMLHRFQDQIRFIINIFAGKPDIVHVNPSLNLKSFIRDGLFLLTAHAAGCRTIVFFRGWDKNFESRITGLLKVFLGMSYLQSDTAIVLASDFKEKLKAWGMQKPVHLLTTAVDETLVSGFSIRRKLKYAASTQARRILFLSRFTREKGIFETINALKLLQEMEVDCTLTIAGDGYIATEVKQYIRDLELDDRIFLPGYIKGDRKKEILANHDIFCLPSYSEGMPNAVLEAMALGLPVVATPVGGIKDFFKNGKMGFLCRQPEPRIIARHLAKILSNPPLWRRMAAYNYHYAKKNFMASSVAEKITAIYRDQRFSKRR